MRNALLINPAQLEFDFADRLRKALRVSDMGPGELADSIEVHRNTISNWINGHAAPRPRDIRAVAEQTGVPLEWLLTGETKKTPTANGEGLDDLCAPRGSNPEPTD
ncbi:MAG: helix-turn-helix domain-containing protein [Microbacteriaceae bacterium]